MSNTLDLWNSVCETDPNYTKTDGSKKNPTTAIDAHYQILEATKLWGPYGSTWGLKDINMDYSLKDEPYNIVSLKAVFWYPSGAFEIGVSQCLLMSRAKNIVDDDFRKKIETNCLTKALSKIGFNADIFLGKFEDNTYVNELKERYKEKQTVPMDEFNKALHAIHNGLYSKEKLVNSYELTFEQTEILNNMT